MNISVAHYVLSRFVNLKDLICSFKSYRSTFRNYMTVLRSQLKRSFPISAILKNGQRITLHSNYELLLFLNKPVTKYSLEYDFANDIVTIGQQLKIYGGTSNGDIAGIFLKGEYRRLPVRGRTVLDLGANIGDSIIYFILEGATRVVGLEPFPKNYQTAEKNIKLNGLSNKVVLLQAGCDSKPGNVVIEPEYRSGTTSQIHEFERGLKIPFFTLENIIDEQKIGPGSILKVDCEGYEYQIILQTPREVLQIFDYILIEYHYGYKNLKSKLEDSGFTVYVDVPHAPHLIRTIYDFVHPTKQENKRPDYLGYVYAVRD